MFIQLRTIVVEPGNAEQVAERFEQPGHIDTMPGLIDRTVMVSRKNKESEEVIAMIRWESEEAWKIGKRILFISQATARSAAKARLTTS